MPAQKSLGNSSEKARKILLGAEVPDCGCAFDLVPMCVRDLGPQGCTPACVTKKNPAGCWRRREPVCVTAENPAGCSYRHLPMCVAASYRQASAPLRPGQARGCHERSKTGRCGCPEVGSCDCPPKGACDCPKAECDCPNAPTAPCPHVLASGHGLAVDKWGRALWSEAADEYAAPPLPPATPRPEPSWDDKKKARYKKACNPIKQIHRDEIVAVLAARREFGFALRHPQDVPGAHEILRMSQNSQRGRNGHAEGLRDYTRHSGHEKPAAPPADLLDLLPAPRTLQYQTREKAP